VTTINIVANVASGEHGFGLVFPVDSFQTFLDFPLAFSQLFGDIPLNSKYSFISVIFVCQNL